VSEQQSALFISDFLATELPKLAAKHKICQTRPLLLALLEAAVVYGAGNWVIQANSQFAGKPDTLNKLPKAIDAVIALLEEPVNRYRLERNPTREIYHELCERQSTKESSVKTSAFSMQSLPLPASLYLDDFILICLKYRRWAIAADQGRGKPPGKQPLIFAYNRLVTFWLEDGPAKFTNKWEQTASCNLVPLSDAACFFYDALNLICPGRGNLTQELRTLMVNTVRGSKGNRRGRKLC
jgi:hypothetical protein